MDAGQDDPTSKGRSRVGRKRDKKHDFQHSGLIDGQTVEGGADLSLAAGFPEDGRAGCVAATPDLAHQTCGVKLLDPVALSGSQFRVKASGGNASVRRRESERNCMERL